MNRLTCGATGFVWPQPSLQGCLSLFCSVRDRRLSEIFKEVSMIIWLVGFWQLPFDTTNIHENLIYTKYENKKF